MSLGLFFRLYDPAAVNSAYYDSESSAWRHSGGSDATCTNYEGNSGLFNDSLDLSGIALSSWIGMADDVNVFLKEYRTTKVTSCGVSDNCNQRSWDDKWKRSATINCSYDEVAVPEPGSIALLGLGLASAA
jgi:hypothetical protein